MRIISSPTSHESSLHEYEVFLHESHSGVFRLFVISSKGVEVDPDKVKAIREWPVPSPLNEICSFHDLATFYRRFILNLSTIAVPIANCMKRGQFIWTMAATQAFEEIKKIMTEPLVLRWLVMHHMLELEVFGQEGHPIAYFNKKLNEAKQKYSTYAKNSMLWFKHFLESLLIQSHPLVLKLMLLRNICVR
jgi:hypothetical protein